MLPAAATLGRETLPLPVTENGVPDPDFIETDAGDAGSLPALARQFRITDLQHWIDLSA